MSQRFSVPEPLREISYRRIDYWCRRGYLHPEDDGLGSGNYRRWPEMEIEVARKMAVLIDGGFTPAAAARIARSTLEASR